MNKSIAVGGIVVLLVLGIGGFFALNNFSDKGVSQENNNQAKKMADGNRINGKFSDLLTQGKDFSCTFDQTDDLGNKNSGIVYYSNSGEKLRGNFSYLAKDGTSYEGGVIRDEEYNYVWTVGQGGLKTKIDPNQEDFFDDNTSSENKNILTNDTEFEFDCDDWNVDNSVFVPPSDITFAELSEGLMPLSPDTQDEQVDCSVCNQIPEGSTKQQCLAALGCN